MAAFTSKGVVAALVVAMAVTGMKAAGASEAQGLMLKPHHGVSFDVGSKRAVGYYLAQGGVCSLTVLMADSNADGDVKGAATRVTIPVIPTRAARIDTAEGKTLEIKCAPSAQAMSIKVLDQVAAVMPKG